MTRVESPDVATISADSAGLGAWVRNFLMRLFGAAGVPGNMASARATDIGDDRESGGSFVLVPGGYRIRVPQATDVGYSVGEMLSTVKEGLNLLPPLPTVVLELLREIQDPKSTAASVAQVASSDPALAASLLRAANGAAMGLSRTISSASEAVSYLGFGTVKGMVIRLRLEDVMPCRNAQAARDSEDLWVHSLIVSYAAECLAKKIGGMDHGFAATLGLLHDIGKLAVLAQMPEKAESLWTNQADDAEQGMLAREASVLGIDHAGLGANLAAKWKLPADLVQAIRNHHCPAGAFHASDPMPLRKSLHIVQIANQLAKYCYPHSDRLEIDAISDETFALLKLDPSLPKLLTTDVRAAISKAIFFATSNSRQPAEAPRRFLRLVEKDLAIQILETSTQEQPSVVNDDVLIANLFGEATATAGGSAPARFAGAATATGVARCVKEAVSHLEKAQLNPDSLAAAILTVKSFVPNLLPLAGGEEQIEVAQLIERGRITIGVCMGALSTERRVGQKVRADASRRLAEVDFAGLINLGWFQKIAVSVDGSTVVFVGK